MFQSFREVKVPLYCHDSQAHSDPAWYYPLESVGGHVVWLVDIFGPPIRSLYLFSGMLLVFIFAKKWKGGK